VAAAQPPGAAGNPDPWSYPSETIDLSARSPDVLTWPPEAASEGRPRRRRLPVIIAAAMVVALVLGGVAYAGARLWYGSGAQPEEATPSTVVAFARLDLSPGFGQRRSINNLVKKFPQESGKDAVDELKKGIFGALAIDEDSYREHVEPWFADRVGVGWWLDAEQRSYGLFTLAAKDESAARTGLTELQRKRTNAGDFGFVVRNGYALVARGDKESQAAAEAAGEEAARESLADSAQFHRGVEWLPGQQTVLAWADLARFGQAMKGMMEGSTRGMPRAPGEQPTPGMGSVGVDPMGALLGIPGLGGLTGMAGPGQQGELKGQVIVGAQATDNGVTVRFRGFGTEGPAPGSKADARSTVDSLPANSAVAGAFRLGDVGKQLAGLGPDSAEMLPPEEALKELPPGEADRMRKEMREQAKQFEATTKVFSALSGAKISVAAAGLEGDIPALLAAAETASAGQAATLVDALKQLFKDQVTVAASGNKVELKTEGYAAEGGTLAGKALYREALDGTPQEATAVLYVDVQRLLGDQKMTGQERRQAEAVKAVGLATGTEDGDQVGMLRVVIR
jgi:hypothetical protein